MGTPCTPSCTATSRRWARSTAGPFRDLHYLAAVAADAGGHVCDDQGRAVPDRGRGVSREQDQLAHGLDHVCELLRALLQALRGQLLLEVERREKAALCPRGRENRDPADHSDRGSGDGG